MAKINNKHKTVGVSFSPQLRQGANRRARQLGLSFSRYVGLCVGAEVGGQVSLGAVQESYSMDALEAAAEDSCVFAQSACDRLRMDVAALLDKVGLPFIRGAMLDTMRVDFCVQTGARVTTQPHGGIHNSGSCTDTDYPEAVAASVQRQLQGNATAVDELFASGAVVNEVFASGAAVVIECRYPAAESHAALLGRAVMLQQVRGISGVLMCVPYLSILDPALRAVFAKQNIGLVTPDTLLQALERAIATIEPQGASTPLAGRGLKSDSRKVRVAKDQMDGRESLT